MPAHAAMRPSAAPTLLLALCLWLAAAHAAMLGDNATLVRNFVATDALVDGEQERRIHYNGLTAKETSVVGAPDQDGTRPGVTLRQVTDGSGFLQLIYGAAGELRDCEFVPGRGAADAFLRSFQQDVDLAAAGGRGRRSTDSALTNVTFQVLGEGSVLPADVSSWLDMTSLRAQCRDKHRELRRLARWHRRGGPRHRAHAELQLNRTKRSLRAMLMAPGTLWCGPNGEQATVGRLGPLSQEDRCCRQHDRCRANINAFATKYHFFNYRPFTISHCHCDHRRKRELVDALRVPGTKWCGKGRSAERYTQLGGFNGADRCCRLHDTTCPFYIAAFQTKYGLFNWRINTLMHCTCDERFRTCLKMAGTGAANLVGKLFFNIVQTKCFVLKPKKVCTRYSWWGKCEKYAYRKQAHLRNNVSY